MSEYFLLSDKKFVLKESMPSGGEYYRGQHDTERVDMTLANEDLRYIPNVNPFLKGRVRSVVTQNNTSLPEVYRLLPFHSVPLTEELQWLWKNINPELSNEKWATLLGSSLAWCNGTGFSDSDPKRDYVNRRN